MDQAISHLPIILLLHSKASHNSNFDHIKFYACYFQNLAFVGNIARDLIGLFICIYSINYGIYFYKMICDKYLCMHAYILYIYIYMIAVNVHKLCV